MLGILFDIELVQNLNVKKKFFLKTFILVCILIHSDLYNDFLLKQNYTYLEQKLESYLKEYFFDVFAQR